MKSKEKKKFGCVLRQHNGCRRLWWRQTMVRSFQRWVFAPSMTAEMELSVSWIRIFHRKREKHVHLLSCLKWISSTRNVCSWTDHFMSGALNRLLFIFQSFIFFVPNINLVSCYIYLYWKRHHKFVVENVLQVIFYLSCEGQWTILMNIYKIFFW